MRPLLETIQRAELIIDQVETKIGLRPYKVYWRKITRVGEDKLLGIKGTEVYKDTAFIPNPIVNHNLMFSNRYPMGYIQEGDIEITFNAGVVTEDFLMNQADYLVFQGILYKVVKVNDKPFDSTPLQRVVLARKHEDA